jgi:hypothetical protein
MRNVNRKESPSQHIYNAESIEYDIWFRAIGLPLGCVTCQMYCKQAGIDSWDEVNSCRH